MVEDLIKINILLGVALITSVILLAFHIDESNKRIEKCERINSNLGIRSQRKRRWVIENERKTKRQQYSFSLL